MAPPDETHHPRWTSRLIELATDVEPARIGGDGEDASDGDAFDRSSSDRVVPRARCRECADRPAVRGLCIECFLE